ncbi:MAG: hypothetical protein ASARMPREDX12_006664 [Alectoria sarmentosa]|nr:MAG: hypothetical protein ASARMPREDX12_006664 [Alectoria sarmentosa]
MYNSSCQSRSPPLPRTPSPLNPFLALAPELKQTVFSFLPDVPALRSVILTCSSFYHSFFDAESVLLTRVLQNQIHPDLTTDALAAFHSSRLGPTAHTWSKDKVREILTTYDHDQPSCLAQHKWNFQDALSFSNLHRHVRHFADTFASSTLALFLEGTTRERDQGQPSPTEQHRIERTFYRFELYCNLFRTRMPTDRKASHNHIVSLSVEGFSLEEEREIFFSRFPVWENEQLACVHDYLSSRLSIPFNDVAEHDILWGKLRIPWADDCIYPHHPWKERFLVRGLTYIRRLDTASTYAERCTLLDWESPREDLSPSLGLSELHGRTYFNKYSPEARDKILNQSCTNDIDAGAKDAWLWAHDDGTRLYYNLFNGHRTLRQWGYVLWDSARLKQSGLLDRAWHDWSVKTQKEEDDHDERNNRYEEMVASWKAKSQIWRLGGRGWWSSENESFVQWPAGSNLRWECRQGEIPTPVEMGQKLHQLALLVEVPITSEMTSVDSSALEDMPTNLESWDNNYMRLTETLVPRDAVTDCQNVTLGFNASCWDLIPRSVGMESWLSTWNRTTTTCKPSELWANCFMREAGVTTNTTAGIRCDLIGTDVCPEPSTEVLESASAEASYGVASIWALQQYMTTLYQFLEGDQGFPLIDADFLNQTAPRSAKTILIDILNELGDPVATQMTTIIGSPVPIKQGTFVIPTEAQAQQIVGQTVGYLLQWIMTDWIDGGFSALAVEGNLISIIAD